MGNVNIPNIETIGFHGFSTQTTFGGIREVNEITPNAEDSTPTRRKSPKCTTAQNLLLLGGWIKYGKDSVVRRNQKSELYWSAITNIAHFIVCISSFVM